MHMNRWGAEIFFWYLKTWLQMSHEFIGILKLKVILNIARMQFTLPSRFIKVLLIKVLTLMYCYYGRVKTGLETEFEIKTFRSMHLQLLEEAGHLFKVFSVHMKRKAGVFKFLQFEKRFWKAPLSRRNSSESRPDHRNKVAFLSFYLAIFYV